MTDENDTTPDEGVTENVELSEDDNSDDFDYYDPDDEDTVEAEDPDETDDEPDEEAVESDDDQETADQTDDDPADVTVTLDDGSQVSLDELKKGHLRQSDYSRKTMELSNQREAVKADVERMTRITETFVDHLSTLVPDAPDASLALTDAAAYTAQKAQHDVAMAKVQELLNLAETPKEVGAQMSEADRKAAMADANQRLTAMFPEIAAPEGREKFMGAVAKTAGDFGFSQQELGSLTDPRVFALAHWAGKGMAAEKAQGVAKEKVAKARPATPRKPGQGAGKPNGNAKAMRKLSRTGSLEDALAVDWE